MNDRKWVPVGATAEMLTVLKKTLDPFGGKVLRHDQNGKIDVEFPNLHAASTYITWQILSDSVVALSVANPKKPYMCKATVTIQS
jgi:hypothetical protein